MKQLLIILIFQGILERTAQSQNQVVEIQVEGLASSDSISLNDLSILFSNPPDLHINLKEMFSKNRKIYL